MRIGRIEYEKLPGKKPGIMFLCGFRSDMTGVKAMALHDYCRARGREFVRFDYSGHGASGGVFEEGSIGAWKDDALSVLDEVTEGRQVMVGSSMGGWIMTLAAMARPERVAGLLGIASAPDFTENMIWNKLPQVEREKLMKEGIVHLPSCYGSEPYPITSKLVEEGRRHLVLGGEIPVSCPVRLIHGMDDEDVPFETSIKLSAAMKSPDIEVRLVKGGNHRMSEPQDIRLMLETLDEVVYAAGA